jgi:hypothetical protein
MILLIAPRSATHTEQCSLAAQLAKKRVRDLSDQMLVDILAVARNEADGGRYPFPFSIKLGSYEGMNKINYFLLLCCTGVLARQKRGRSKKETRRIEVTNVKIPARSTR